MNIVDFITARLDDDEKTARAARPGPWIDEGGYSGPKIGVDYLMVPTDGSAPCNDEIPREDSRHIARHDPARALCEVQSKRKLVNFYGEIQRKWGPNSDYLMADFVLRTLASVYADHPDFNQKWRL